ncbi:hypothetical protein BD769DRAFT_315925 [Suillus cothurnatus]|nr:hypothetical protein BD769DRAFT_315925 [Suillus cothurnatus]
MTLVSNDPSWWPIIDANLISSYFVVASCAGVMYDWGLTFGPEVELIWRQRWSLMTVLYLIVRYVGIGYAVISLLLWVPTISTTDAVSRTMYDAFDWTGVRCKCNARCHRDRSVICHVSAIQKGADISRCHLCKPSESPM